MEAMKVYRRGLERSALVMRGSRTVAEVFTDREPGDQYETAQLFAAAPALLAALMACVEGTEPGEDCPLPPALYNLACAAIARATGED